MTASGAARPPISVQLYTVRDALAADTPGTLRRIADLGLRTVEPFDLVGAVDRLAGPMAELGLTAPTTHVSFVDGGLDAALAAAGRLGVGTIIEPYLPEERWTTRADVAAIAAGAQRRRATRRRPRHHGRLPQPLVGAGACASTASPRSRSWPTQLDDAVVLELDTYWCAVGGADPVAMLGTPRRAGRGAAHQGRAHLPGRHGAAAGGFGRDARRRDPGRGPRGAPGPGVRPLRR